MQQGKGRINHFEEHIARTIKMKTFFPSTRIKRSAREFVGVRDEQEVKKKIIQRRQDFRKNRRIHPYDQCLRIQVRFSHKLPYEGMDWKNCFKLENEQKSFKSHSIRSAVSNHQEQMVFTQEFLRNSSMKLINY